MKKKKVPPEITKFFTELGRKGGKKSWAVRKARLLSAKEKSK
jgi:hypothetical protein